MIRWIITLSLLFGLMPLVAARAQSRTGTDETERQLEREIREQDEREISCECCMNCRAATQSTPGKTDNSTKSDGCQKCCDTCGRQLPIDRKVPPEKEGR